MAAKPVAVSARNDAEVLTLPSEMLPLRERMPMLPSAPMLPVVTLPAPPMPTW